MAGVNPSSSQLDVGNAENLGPIRNAAIDAVLIDLAFQIIVVLLHAESISVNEELVDVILRATVQSRLVVEAMERLVRNRQAFRRPSGSSRRRWRRACGRSMRTSCIEAALLAQTFL